MTRLKVLVIIVTYNGIKWIDRCVRSVNSKLSDVHILIIDNGSTDGTLDYVISNFKEVKVIANHDNLGFGKANNLGLKYAIDNAYNYVYLLNQDGWIDGDSLDALLSAHQNNPEYGILSPMQLNANKTWFDKIFAEKVVVSSIPFINDLFFGINRSVYDVPWVMAAHWLISLECLQCVGLFSPSFPHYGEDDNYIDRVYFHNFKVGIVPGALAIHDREDRVNSIGKNIYFDCYKNFLVQFSEPRQIHFVEWIKMVYLNFRMVFYYRSSLPVRYGLKLILQSSKIRKNRYESMKIGAFAN